MPGGLERTLGKTLGCEGMIEDGEKKLHKKQDQDISRSFHHRDPIQTISCLTQSASDVMWASPCDFLVGISIRKNLPVLYLFNATSGGEKEDGRAFSYSPAHRCIGRSGECAQR